MAGLIVGRALRLPAIVSYLVAGVLAGPGGVGLVTHSQGIDQLAERGVRLVRFGCGIEFSLERLRRTAGRMVASGAAQVGLTVAAATALFHALGVATATALLAGFAVALSSTAIVFKLYDDAGELDAPQG